MFVNVITKGGNCFLFLRCRCMSSKSGGGSSIARQSRAMEKLFGNRIAGSKKRHWPTEGMLTPHSQGNLFKGTPTARNGKNSTRRMQVLNKLFMENISQLLAEVESVLNYGLQIQRVKISPDFTMVYVYWVGSGDAFSDEKLEMELKKRSGLLRHELSQLRLMGEVPRINFVHDRTLANLTQVDSMLRNMSLEDDDDGNVGHNNVVTSLKQDEFFGKFKTPFDAATTSQPDIQLNAVPEMRHDVLGLDHRDIMTRILAKMKKSKAAWDMHNQITISARNNDLPLPEMTKRGDLKYLEQINLKMVETAEAAAKFDQFLAKRRERKNIPERKKHNRLDDEGVDGGSTKNQTRNENIYEEAVLSANRRRLLHEEDYIDDDDDYEKNGTKM